jgi:hypothetical protein
LELHLTFLNYVALQYNSPSDLQICLSKVLATILSCLTETELSSLLLCHREGNNMSDILHKLPEV